MLGRSAFGPVDSLRSSPWLRCRRLWLVAEVEGVDVVGAPVDGGAVLAYLGGVAGIVGGHHAIGGGAVQQRVVKISARYEACQLLRCDVGCLAGEAAHGNRVSTAGAGRLGVIPCTPTESPSLLVLVTTGCFKWRPTG